MVIFILLVVDEFCVVIVTPVQGHAAALSRALPLLDAAAPLASLCVGEHDTAGPDGTPLHLKLKYIHPYA